MRRHTQNYFSSPEVAEHTGREHVGARGVEEAGEQFEVAQRDELQQREDRILPPRVEGPPLGPTVQPPFM